MSQFGNLNPFNIIGRKGKKDPSGFWFTPPKRQINLVRVAGTSEMSYPNSGIEILRCCIPRRDNLGKRIFPTISEVLGQRS